MYDQGVGRQRLTEEELRFSKTQNYSPSESFLIFGKARKLEEVAKTLEGQMAQFY